MGPCSKVKGFVVGDVTVVKLERWHGGSGAPRDVHELSRLYISDEGHVALDYGYGPDPLGQITVKPEWPVWTLVYLALHMWGHRHAEQKQTN